MKYLLNLFVWALSFFEWFRISQAADSVLTFTFAFKEDGRSRPVLSLYLIWNKMYVQWYVQNMEQSACRPTTPLSVTAYIRT